MYQRPGRDEVMYSREVIDEVISRNDIVDVISGYVKLKKNGSSYTGLCPFHNEKSPSFSVSGQRQLYHCFGCGAGGNVITFVMEYENMTFLEAVKMLGERAGVALPQTSMSEEDRKERGIRDRLLEINKIAATYYYRQLRSENGKAGLDYLKKRELSDSTINSFGLGYATQSTGNLYKLLKDKGFFVQTKDVIAVEIEDRSGSLNQMLEVLAEGNISINYIYSFVIREDQAPVMVFQTEYLEEAVQILKNHGINVID